MGNENTINKKNRAYEYAGQLCSIKRKKQVLSVIDALSHVNNDANTPYLELLHPASTYRISILGDIENGISVKANILPEHIKRIWMRVQYAEKLLFDKEISVQAPAASEEVPSNSLVNTAAFTVTFKMGALKGQSPASVISNATDKDAAIDELKKQYDFLEQNVSKYQGNKVIMDAIKMAIDFHEMGELDGETAANVSSPVQRYSSTFIYNPPEKTFRQETTKTSTGLTLTKCYKLTITFNPERDYPYNVYIKNQYAQIVKNEETKMEVIRYVDSDSADAHEYTFHLTSDEMVYLIGSMVDNKMYYESCIYTCMRKTDQAIQAEKRKKIELKNK